MELHGPNGTFVAVTPNNQLETHATVSSQTHWYSAVTGEAYAFHAATDTLSAAKVAILYMKNTSTNLDLVVDWLEFQVIDNTAGIPSVAEFFDIDIGGTCTGGTATTVSNLNTGVANEAQATVLDSTPTISVAGTNIYKRFLHAAEGEPVRYDPDGGLILAPNGSMILSITTDTGDGKAYCNGEIYFETQGAG